MRHLTRKLRLGLAGLAVLALVLPATAAASVSLTGIDASHYPTVRATVISSAGPRYTPVVTENGTPVTGLQAINLASSKSVVLAIDRSQSMQGKSFKDAIAAARSFVAQKPANDDIAVVALASGVLQLSRFSQNASDADSALAGLTIDSHQGTALYDGIDSAVNMLGGQAGGKVLILLTDGTDTTSKHTLDEAVKDARDHDVLVYPIAIAGPSYDPTALETIAHETGGTFYRTSSSGTLTDVYSSIADALRNTWRVEYLTAARPGDHVSLQATVPGVGSATESTTIPLSFGGTLPAPSKLVPDAAYGPSGPIAIGLAVGALILIALVMLIAAYRGSWVKTRIAAHVGDTKTNAKQKRKNQRHAALSSIFTFTERTLGNMKQWRAIHRMLERADVPLRTVEFFWIMLGSAVGLGLVAAISGQSAFVVLLALLGGCLIPLGYVWFKMRRRLRAFEDQLPDLLVTIAASLKAGHSFKQGLQAVVEEGQPPASQEFKRVLTETALGRPMDEALAEMADRSGSKNFEFAITAVTIQRQIGGSLAGLFDMVADTVRQRQQFARKIRGLTAMGRMSSYTLMGVPFFIAAMVTLINPGYMSPLYHTHAGHLMMTIGLVMMVIGSIILKKIVSFKG